MNLTCPFCNSKNLEIINQDKYQYNSYSFILSRYKDCSETELINNAQPMKCSSCSLSFYNNWISSDDNLIIYKELVPIHPSCANLIDRESHFTLEYLRSRLLILSGGDVSDEVKGCLRREINALLTSIGMNCISDSLSNAEINNIVKSFNEIITNFRLESILIPGTKYGGFYHHIVQELICNYINNSIDKSSKDNYKFFYTEIGCPTWGFLGAKKLKENSLCFCTDVCENFWFSHEEYCGSTSLQYNKNYSNKLWEDIHYSTIIAAFACIDHANNLSSFLTNLLVKTNFLIGTFEESPVGVAPPIQHHYSLNDNSLKSALSNISFKVDLSTNKSIYNKYTFFEIKILGGQ